MKTMRFILGSIIVIFGAIMLNSCSKSDDPAPTDLTPSIAFVGGAGYTSGDATLEVNAAFKVGITAFSNTSSSAKLVKLAVTRVFNNIPLTSDTVINVSTLNWNLNLTANSLVGAEKWYFKVTDKNNQTKEISFTITTVAPSGPINTFSMKILGAQGNTTGSSFASIDGTIYNLADAKANASKIDWLYFYGATNLATLASPNDAAAAEVFNDETNGLLKWAVRNNTLFKKVAGTIDWENITTDEVIVAQTASGVTNTKINSLAANDVLAFIAASGKKGMIKVESITGTNNGSITISVKVQQ